MADVPMDVCYQMSNAKIVAVKNPGSQWSDIEKGLAPTHLGAYFKVATVPFNNPTQMEKILGTKVIQINGVDCTVPGDDAIVLEDGDKDKDWVVDDVSAPTKIKQRKDP